MTKRSVLKNKKSKFTSWKTYQSDSHTHKRVWTGVLVLIALLLIILIGKAVGFFGSINSSYNPDSIKDYVTYSWDGSTNLNVLIKGATISVVSISPQSKSLSIIKIPDETYTNLPKGYGSWPIRSVYGLGQSEKEPFGAGLLALSATSILGVPVDRYIILPDDSEMTPEKTLEEIRSNLPGIFSVLLESKTNLSAKEYFKFITRARSVRFDKVKNIDLSQTNSTKRTLLHDGSRGLEINITNLDKHLAGDFEDKIITNEGLSIAIYNATEHSIQAEKAARVITNLGGRVVLTSSTSQRVATTIILGKESETKKYLIQILSPSCQKTANLLKFLQEDKCAKITDEITKSSETSDINLSRADVSIIIGEDYYNKFNLK